MTKRILLVNIASLLLFLMPCRVNSTDVDNRVSLGKIISHYGFPAPSETAKHITLKSKYTTMTFEANSRKLLFNGLLIWMNAPLIKDTNNWTLSKSDVTKIIDPLLRSQDTLSAVNFTTVVLDPGHGGQDTGAIGRRKVYEKKVVLDIAKRARKKLITSGITVKLTRERDYNLSLPERTARAQKWGADIFVSIHVNSAHNSSASGFETYVLPCHGFSSTAGSSSDKKSMPGNKYDAPNTLLAHYIQKGMIAYIKGTDRGVRRAKFDVLRNASCPAVLVECGFVSNRTEENRMTQPKYRDDAAEAITRGILTYISNAERARKPGT